MQLQKALVMILLVFVCFFGAGMDQAQAADLSFSEMEDYLSQFDQELSEMEAGFSLRELWQEIQAGDLSWDISSILGFIGQMFLRELFAGGQLLGQLLVLGVVCLVLVNLKESFGNSDISLLARSVVFLLLLTIVLASFSSVLNYAGQSIQRMSGFVNAVLPLLMTLLASMGSLISVGLLNPVMLLALSLILHLIEILIFPLIFFSAVLKLVGYISPRFNLSRLAGLLKDIALGAMSISMTVFVALLSFTGIAGAVSDGLAVKAAKTASGAFLPVIGRTLADSLDSVLSTSLLLKNGIGLVGLIVILLLCALPALKILAQVLLYRLAAAILQPLGENQLSDALFGLSGSLLFLFGVVAAAGLLFFFVLAVTVGAGNISMMMR